MANLAVAFARIGKRVILVDCDLRHPAQHTLFGLANSDRRQHGRRCKAVGRLPLQATDVPCLRVLTSGPAVEVPADLIGSTGMAGLIARLREEADMVIFDAPPVVLATDAAELASQVDGVLLTVSAGQTKREDAQQAKELLATRSAPIWSVWRWSTCRWTRSCASTWRHEEAGAVMSSHTLSVSGGRNERSDPQRR